MKKTGYVAIIGKTNAGKSTFLNRIIGQKISIVSPKKQTTRENILGILTENNYQIIFVDTPGIHKSKNALDKSMNKQIRIASEGVNLILYMIDATQKIDESEVSYLTHLIEKSNAEEVPVIVLISKSEIAGKAKVFEIIETLKEVKAEIIPFSTFKNMNVDLIKEKIVENLPECDYFEFSDDEITDKSIRFLVSEIIREKALYLLNEEIPHGIAVDIIEFNEKTNEIAADIVCEKDSHKGIIIGKGGEMIKKIGSQARRDIERLLSVKVNLKLFVKVEKNWRQKGKFDF